MLPRNCRRHKPAFLEWHYSSRIWCISEGGHQCDGPNISGAIQFRMHIRMVQSVISASRPTWMNHLLWHSIPPSLCCWHMNDGRLCGPFAFHFSFQFSVLKDHDTDNNTEFFPSWLFPLHMHASWIERIFGLCNCWAVHRQELRMLISIIVFFEQQQ